MVPTILTSGAAVSGILTGEVLSGTFQTVGRLGEKYSNHGRHEKSDHRSKRDRHDGTLVSTHLNFLRCPSGAKENVL